MRWFNAGVLLFFISIICMPLSAKDVSWQLAHHNKNQNLWVWKLKGAKGVVGTLQTSKQSKPVDLKSLRKKGFLKKFTTKRQDALKNINITQWTANEHKWKKKKGYYELTLNGSYRNAQNHLIRFYETHLFSRQKTHQILFSYPSKAPVNRSIASDFIQRAKRKISK